jgi:hypothetical protein
MFCLSPDTTIEPNPSTYTFYLFMPLGEPQQYGYSMYILQVQCVKTIELDCNTYGVNMCRSYTVEEGGIRKYVLFYCGWGMSDWLFDMSSTCVPHTGSEYGYLVLTTCLRYYGLVRWHVSDSEHVCAHCSVLILTVYGLIFRRDLWGRQILLVYIHMWRKNGGL